MNLTHTGILGFDVDYAIPVVSMTAEDQGQLEKFVDRGITPRVRINVQNTLTSGRAETANVVGEIRGREHPEEIFVVGGHLDSWDLAQGTTGQRSGTATTLGAAEAIMRSGQKPRRTIRFVLFTGEEQGLDGSFAYYKQHQSEWANHLGNLFWTRAGASDRLHARRARRSDCGVPAVCRFAGEYSSHQGERQCGVRHGHPAVFDLRVAGHQHEPGNEDYMYTHHSAADALEAQKPDVLTQNATLMALTAYWIADRPERSATPWPAERTAKMLREKGEYEELKAFKIWPYGNLGEGPDKK